VSSDDQDASVSAHPQPDAAQPALDLVLFLAFAGVPYNQVEGASAEKELVSDPIHFLTAKVPCAQDHVQSEIRVAHGKWLNLNTVRSGPTFNEGGIMERRD
jgi:hypothetical protein